MSDLQQHKHEKIGPSRSVLKVALELWSESGEEHWLPVSGSSMLPLILDGDRILITHNVTDIRRGDILLFKWPEGIVAHRLLNVLQNPDGQALYTTHGDNVSNPDEPITADKVVGRVLAIQRGDRYMRLDTPSWRLASRLIARMILLRTRLYTLGSGLKRSIFITIGYEPIVSQQRIGKKSSAMILRALQSLVGRWRE